MIVFCQAHLLPSWKTGISLLYGDMPRCQLFTLGESKFNFWPLARVTSDNKSTSGSNMTIKSVVNEPRGVRSSFLGMKYFQTCNVNMY